MRKCDYKDCTHKGWWRCLRCGFTICGDCHDDEFPQNKDIGNEKAYCPTCAEYHEEYEEIAWLQRGLK